MRLARIVLKSGGGRRLGLIKGQKGYMLIEVIVAVAIVGIIAVAFLSALSSGYMALVLADENTVAESLTRTEFERIRQAAYPVSGDNTSREALPGYYVKVTVDAVDGSDSSIQLVTVEVHHSQDTVLTLDESLLITSSYKVDPNKNLPS